MLDAFVRVRTPQDVARVAAGDPHRLVPRLLVVARAVSPARERHVVHALRVAGVAGRPERVCRERLSRDARRARGPGYSDTDG
ncbi:hypothetical protein [Streptomyces sp. NPDC102437]|uniref:hypothetical protein n=1 Tax=Streptomyces sp. NPDC102437 TaxID=3366175 RepID=UPI00380EEF75